MKRDFDRLRDNFAGPSLMLSAVFIGRDLEHRCDGQFQVGVFGRALEAVPHAAFGKANINDQGLIRLKKPPPWIVAAPCSRLLPGHPLVPTGIPEAERQRAVAPGTIFFPQPYIAAGGVGNDHVKKWG